METDFAFGLFRRRIEERLKALEDLAQHDVVLDEFLVDLGETAEDAVKAVGGLRLPPWLKLEVAICDFKFATSSHVMTKQNSSGNRSALRRTASVRRFGSTPYSKAKSELSTTRCLRIV